jgi:UDP-N-acetylmuramoylalanine--D-glutamate ligase
MISITSNLKRNVEQLAGARVAVLGAARSGIAISVLMAEAGASVLLSDIKSADLLDLPFKTLKDKNIVVVTGEHPDKILEYDMICISPGIPLTIPILQRAKNKNIPIVGEIEVASWFCASPIIAVTGSNGKTTTTTLTGRIFQKNYPHTIVAGNIGSAFSEYVLHSTPNDYAILEISSFQMETIVSFHPRITVFMNLTPNHLDRYPNFSAYAEAKLNILKNLETEDVIIYNKDDEYLTNSLKNNPCHKMVFSRHPHDQEGAYWKDDKVYINLEDKSETVTISGYRLLGPHNQYNMTVATLLGSIANISSEVIASEIASFPGIEHRLEFVREIQGIRFINDSKATTVDSLAFALQSFQEKVVLIAGGKDKGGSYDKIKELLSAKVKHAVLIGNAAEKMAKSWKKVIPISRVNSLIEAVNMAYQHAGKGDIVLLSPACSSFDMFRDYEDRGEKFKQIVKNLKI